MMKLFSQLEQVESATPFARSDDGNISVDAVSRIHPKSAQRQVYLMALPKAQVPKRRQN